MTTGPNTPSAEDARQALHSVTNMALAGWRRSVPPRWVCMGYAFFNGSPIAMFSVEPLKVVYFSWLLVAYIIFMSFAVKSINAKEREYHPPKDRLFSYWSCWVGLLAVGAGGI